MPWAEEMVQSMHLPGHLSRWRCPALPTSQGSHAYMLSQRPAPLASTTTPRQDASSHAPLLPNWIGVNKKLQDAGVI